MKKAEMTVKDAGRLGGLNRKGKPNHRSAENGKKGGRPKGSKNKPKDAK